MTRTAAPRARVLGSRPSGSSEVESLDGEQFLILRSHWDHPDIPDAISIIGDTNGLRLHYFDARGVHRLFELTVTDDGWAVTMARHRPTSAFASSDAPFSQRMTYAFQDDDQVMAARGELSHDDLKWTTTSKPPTSRLP